MAKRLGLLNYTTEVSPEKTASEILAILAKHGARRVLTEYDKDGFVSAISFVVNTPYKVAFRLPIDVDTVLKVLRKHRQEGKIRIAVNEERARKVAWRIMKDWVSAQMAIIETEMVKLEQVFLPYVITKSGKTLFDMISESRYQLPEGQEGEWKESKEE